MRQLDLVLCNVSCHCTQQCVRRRIVSDGRMRDVACCTDEGVKLSHVTHVLSHVAHKLSHVAHIMGHVEDVLSDVAHTSRHVARMAQHVARTLSHDAHTNQ